jgi:hypothetical protein
VIAVSRNSIVMHRRPSRRRSYAFAYAARPSLYPAESSRGPEPLRPMRGAKPSTLLALPYPHAEAETSRLATGNTAAFAVGEPIQRSATCPVCPIRPICPQRPTCPIVHGVSHWDSARECPMGQRQPLEREGQDAAHGAPSFKRRASVDFGMPVRCSMSRNESPLACIAARASSELSEMISLVFHLWSAKQTSNGSAYRPRSRAIS